MSSVLDLVDVTVVRGEKTLLDGVNWTVRDGERWVILGPNGAGKSTLLSIAAARLHPTRGMVDILDEILGAVDVFELRPRIGVSSAPGSGKSTTSRRNSSGIWVSRPAPSPVPSSPPTAPRCSRLRRAVSAASTMSWEATPSRVATTARPHASFSSSERYRP